VLDTVLGSERDELSPPHELASDEAHNVAHHWTISALVHRSEIFPLRSVQGLGCVKTPATAAHVETSRRNKPEELTLSISGRFGSQ
jgi:hypothetical protein